MDLIERNKLRMKELAAGRPRLAEQVDALDWSELEAALEECIFKKEESGLPETYGPAGYLPIEPEDSGQEKLYAQALEHGESLVRAGKTAAFTVAGGQGTRLGYDGPKGTLPVSPIKGKPLFQLFAEQILRVSEKHGVAIPWYVMCSPLNLEATVAHFEEKKFYGLGMENQFFSQGVMPPPILMATSCWRRATAWPCPPTVMADPSRH